jgi:hypothetical protein
MNRAADQVRWSCVHVLDEWAKSALENGISAPHRSGWPAKIGQGYTTRTTITGLVLDLQRRLERLGSGVPARIDCRLSPYAEVEWFRHRESHEAVVTDFCGIPRVGGGWVFCMGSISAVEAAEVPGSD